MSRTAEIFRLALGAGGLVVIVAGAASLVGVPLAALVSIVLFLALGVIANDAVIAPLTLAGGAAARNLLPRGWLAPVVVATVMLGTLSVVALPVLVGINESPDNTTVVDRPYRATWIVLLGLTVAAVAVAGAIRSARSRQEQGPLDGADGGSADHPTGAARGLVPAGVTGSGAVTTRTRGGAASTAALTVVVTAAAAVRAVRPGRRPRPGS